MIVLLTGSSGFIGNAILKNLISNGHIVYCLKRTQSEITSQLVDSVLDITHKDLDSLMIEFDVLIHAGWGGTRGNLRDDEKIQIQNILDLEHLLSYVEKFKFKTIMSFGSQAEYGNVDEINSNTLFNPINYYGKYKIKAKELLNQFCEENSIRFVWLRLFSVYGPNDYEKSLINILINSMLQNQPIDLTESIHYWDYLYIDDFLSIFNFLLENSRFYGEFNIAYGESKKLKDFIDIIRRITNSDSKLNYGAIKYPESGSTNLIVNIEKLTEITGWRPSVSFEDGISEIIKTRNHSL